MRLSFIILFLFAALGLHAQNASHPQSAQPGIFDSAFLKGTKVKVEDSLIVTFYTKEIGKINIETGRILVCDPIMIADQHPFVVQFPTGQFPVQLAIAKVEANELVGFARILFSQQPVVRWELALLPGQLPRPIFSDSAYCFPVDAGLGGFMDEGSFNRFQKLTLREREEFINGILPVLNKNSRASWEYANFEAHGIQIFAFTSGSGDGCYSTYVGYDKDGKPCRVLVDFRMVGY